MTAMSIIESAPWQRIAVPTSEKGTKEFVICKAPSEVLSYRPTPGQYYVIDEAGHTYAITHVIASNKGREEKLGCFSCRIGLCTEGVDCEHTRATYEFIKRKQEFEDQKVEYEVYIGLSGGGLHVIKKPKGEVDEIQMLKSLSKRPPSTTGSFDTDKMVELGLWDKNNPEQLEDLEQNNLILWQWIMGEFFDDYPLFGDNGLKEKIPTEEESTGVLKQNSFQNLKEGKISFCDHEIEDRGKGKYLKVVFTFDPGYRTTFYVGPLVDSQDKIDEKGRSSRL